MDDNTESIETENSRHICVHTTADEEEEIHRQTEHQLDNDENDEDESSDKENKRLQKFRER